MTDNIDRAIDFRDSGIPSLNDLDIAQARLDALMPDSDELEVEDSNSIGWSERLFKPTIMAGDLPPGDGESGNERMGFNGHTLGAHVGNLFYESLFDKKYQGLNGEETNLATQALNINVRDALQIGITSLQNELRTQEGAWLPLIETAKSYLENKKTLAMMAPDSEGYLELLGLILEQEKTVKLDAAKNPYLRDIFYGPATEPAFTYPGLLAPRTAPLSLVFDALEKGHWQLPELSWQLNNKELDDKLTAQTKIDVKLQKLLEKEADAGATYFEKDSLLKAKQLALKTRHMLHDPLLGIVPLGVIYDPELIDPIFDLKRSEADISLVEPETWKYGITHLGSSYSEISAMGATAVIGGAVKYGAKVAGSYLGPAAPLAWASTEAAFNLMSTAYFRHKETAAEVMSNYAEKIINAGADGMFDTNKVLGEYKELLSLMGYDTSKMEDLEVLQFGLAYNVQTSDPEYNRFAKDARSGLTKLEETNNALSLSDYAENFGLSYGGKLIKEAFGARAITNKVSKAFRDNKKLSKAADMVNRKLDRAVNATLPNASSRLVTRRILDLTSDLAARLGKTYIAERTEEGIQSLAGKEYQNTEVGSPEQEYSLLRGAFLAADLAVEANLAYHGLHWNDLYNTDEQLKREMDIGGFIGVLMGGVGNVSQIRNADKQLKSDRHMVALAARGFDNADRSYKAAQFLNSYINGNTPEYLVNTIESLKQYRSPEVTDQMIDEDADLARQVYGIYKNKELKKNFKALKLDRNENKEFEYFVLTQVDLLNRSSELRQYVDNAAKSQVKVSDKLFGSNADENNPIELIIRKLYARYLKSANTTNTEQVDYETFKQPIIQAITTRATARVLTDLKKDLKSRKKTLQLITEEYGIPTSVAGIDGTVLYIEELEKNTKEILKALDDETFAGTLKYLPDPEGIEELDKAIAVTVLNSALKNVVDTKLSTYMTGRLPVSQRYLVEEKPVFSNLTSERLASVLEEYAELYKLEHKTDKEPTRKQVISYYDTKINQEWSALEESPLVEENERRLANFMFEQDFTRAATELLLAKRELAEEVGAEPDPTVEAESTPESTAATEPVQTPDPTLTAAPEQVAAPGLVAEPQQPTEPGLTPEPALTAVPRQVAEPELTEEPEQAAESRVVREKQPTGSDKKDTSQELATTKKPVSPNATRTEPATPVDQVETPEDTVAEKPGDATQTQAAAPVDEATDNSADTYSDFDIDEMLDDVAENGFISTNDDYIEEGRKRTKTPKGQVDEVQTDNAEAAKYDGVEDDGIEELRAKYDEVQDGGPLATIDEVSDSSPTTIDDEVLDSGPTTIDDEVVDTREVTNDAPADTDEVIGIDEATETPEPESTTLEPLSVRDTEDQPAQTPEEPTVPELQQEETDTPATPEVKKPTPTDLGLTAVVTAEAFDGSTDEEIPIVIEESGQMVYSDGPDTWIGDPDPNEGIHIPEAELSILTAFEEVDAVDMGTSAEGRDYLGLTDKSPGLDTRRKVETNRIHSTFFFLPTSEDIMPIQANGNPMEFDGERRPGKELAKKLAIPGWLSKQRAYYVVTDSQDTRKGERDAADRLAVHLIIEETTEDGKKLIYNTALYTPDKARTKISKWGVDMDKQAVELRKLRKLRKSIIDKYLSTYAPTYFTDPKAKLPLVAPKGIIPVGLRQSNGSIDSMSNNSRPIYRPLTEIKAFGLSSDPVTMSKLIVDGEVEFGYGRGVFTLDPSDRYTIVQFDGENLTSAQGVGYAGKIYIIPKVSNTPSQRNSAPIMLAEKRHFIPGGSKNLVTSYTPDGKAKYDENGKRIPLSSAELIFRMVIRLITVNDPDLSKDLLGILANTGSRTIRAGNEEMKLSFLVRKTLYTYKNDRGETILVYAQRASAGQYRLKYLKVRDANNRPVFTDEQAYDVIRQISNNLHWNTDKVMMMEPISDRIVDAAIEYMTRFNRDYYMISGCEDFIFTMEDLNLKKVNGKIVRNGETPILMSWMINHQVLKTDVADDVFTAPFVYADDAAVAESGNVPTTETKPAEAPKAKPEVKEELPTIVTPTADAPKPETDKLAGHVALTYDETKARGLTPKQGFTYVLKPDGSTVILPNSSKVLQRIMGKGVTSVVRGQGKVDIDKAKQWLHDHLGIDPEDVMATNAIMRMAGAPSVYGLLLVSFDRILLEFAPLITLSTQAGEGIEFHEAWHYVSLLVLNEAQRNLVYSDFVKRNPLYRDYTKSLVEEVLAEEFRAYMLNETNPSIGYLVKKFFRSVWNLVKSLGGKQYNLLSEVFNAIRKGKFKKATLDPNTLEEFNKKYQEGVAYYAPGISKEDQEKTPHITNASTMYNVVEALSSTALASLDIRSMEDINNLKLDDVFDLIQFMYDNMEYDDNEVKKQIVSDVLLNKELFAKQIRLYLQELGIRAIEQEATEIAERDARDRGDEADNVWDKASYDISKKANTSFNAKLFFYSIPQSKFVLDADGVQLLDAVKDNIFGLDMVQPFDVTWNMIMENLWESNDWPDLVSKVRNLANANPFFARLLLRIDNPAYPLPENTITELLTTIQSAKNSMDTVEVVDALLGKMWVVRDSDNLRKIARLPSQWSLNFMLSSMVTVDSGNRSVINTKRFKELDTLNRSILASMEKITKTLDDTNSRAENIKRFNEIKSEFLELTNMIGIPFDVESLNYMLNSITGNSTEPIPGFNAFKTIYTAKDKAASGTNRILGSIANSIMSNIRLMVNGKSVDVTVKKLKISASRIFNYKSPNAVINLMAIAYGLMHPTPEEFSVTGADGNLVYPITQNNYMSDQLRWLNTNAHGKLERLQLSPYSANSLIVKALTGPNKPKLKLHTLIAINDSESNTSRDYFGISPLEDYITKLVIAENSRIILPTMSDKKTWYSIEGITLPKDMLHSVKLQENESGVWAYTPINRRFSDNTLNTFYNYFLDEYNAIVLYYNTKADVEKNKSKYYDNYHGKIGKDGKMKPGGNGGRFRYFNQVLIKGEYVSLNKLLDAAEKSGSPEMVAQTLKFIKRSIIDDRAKAYELINDLLLDRTHKEVERAIKLGVIERGEDGKLKYGNLPTTSNPVEDSSESNVFSKYEEAFAYLEDDTDKENDIVFSIIANYVTNYAISIEEVEKCFTGDPAFYKWKVDGKAGIYQRDVDKIKRLSSVLSTGTNLRTYWGEGDPRNDTRFVSAVLQDNMIGSEYHQRLEDIFKADLIRTMIRKNDPNKTDSELFELTKDEKAIRATLKDRDLLSEEDVKFINEQAKIAALPYAYDEENNSGNINQADAAVYIRPAFYKRIMQAIGEWSPEIEDAYKLLESDGNILGNPELYAKALKAVIKPLKMVYFGDHFDNVSGINVPVFDKMALFPMFKVLAKADNKYLYERMNNRTLGTIDMLKFESATKVGSPRDKLKVYLNPQNTELNKEGIGSPSSTIITPSGEVRDRQTPNRITTTVQDISLLRLQLNTDPHEDTERSFGTQALKMCIANVVDSRDYGSNKGLNVTGEQIKRDVFGCINALAAKGYQNINSRFFNRNGSINRRALAKYLIDLATGTNMSMEVVEALNVNDNGQFISPIASMSVRNWIESRIISLINKEVIDVNTPGGSAILMAPFGFRKNDVVKEGDARAFNDGNKLSFDPDKGSMEIMLSTNFFRDVVPEEHQKDYTSMRSWLVENGVIGTGSKPYGIGYRIPTQGLSSTFSFVVADVLPANTGDTIVVPDEFTSMTGSDYDVDKLYIATYAYNPETHTRYEWDNDRGYYGLTEGALVNKLLDSYALVVSDEKTLAETRASIDTLTSILRDLILPKVQVTEVKEADPMYELSPAFQELRKTEYSSGKAGIAPFALNSTNHCLTQAVHLRMKYSTGASKYNLGNLDDIDGQDGRKILDWLSAMINAHVDVAKDPYIIALNINQVTYNMTNLLLRGGKGKLTFLFLALPAIREFSNSKIANQGIVGVTKRSDNLIWADIKKLYRDMLDDMPITDEQRQSIDSMIRDNYDLAFNELVLNDSLQAFKNDDAKLKHVVQQLICIQAYLDLSSDAQTLADLVQRSQIDTKKYGNNLVQLLNFYNSYATFMQDNLNKFYTNTQESNGLDVYFDNTFLRKKLIYAMDLANSILQSQVFSATDGYKSIFSSVLNQIRGGDYLPINNGNSILHLYNATSDKMYIKNIHDKLESIIRAKVVMNGTNLRLEDDLIGELLFGKNNIAKLLNQIKNYIRQHKDDPAIITLVGEDGTVSNDLLNYLLAVTANRKSNINYLVTASSSMNNSRHFEDRLRSAFYDLLTNDDPVIKEFAELLVKYAFLTSYDNRTPNSFFNVVPLEYKRQLGYIDSIKDALNKLNNHDLDILGDDHNPSAAIDSVYLNLVRNYWKDNGIVPVHIRRLKKDDNDNEYSSNTVNLASSTDKKYRNVNTVIGIRGSYDIRANHKFLKIMNANDSDAVLYQRVGEIVDLDSNSKAVEVIYVAVPKLGYAAGSNSIYELYKRGNEQSAFDDNNFTDKMIEQTTTGLNDLIDRRLKVLRTKDSGLMYMPDSEYQSVDFATYESMHEQALLEASTELGQTTEVESTDTLQADDFVDNSTDESTADDINTMDDALLPDVESVETTQEESIEATEDMDLGFDTVEVIDNILNSAESMEDTTTEVEESTVDDLIEKGKQRKKECE